jgi:hypothetical protein
MAQIVFAPNGSSIFAKCGPQKPSRARSARWVHACLASPLHPTLDVLFVYMQWQQTKAKDTDAAQTKAFGNTLKVATCHLLSQ